MLVNIQFLRFAAALFVVLYHIDPLFPVGSPMRNLLYARQYGFAGVDLFFVISGYIMWYTTQHSHGGSDAWRFLKRRLLRIYSGYWPYFAIALLLLFTLQPEWLAKKRLLESFLLTPMAIPERLIPVSWTLTFELFFYLLFAGLILLQRRWLPQVIAALVVALAVINVTGWLLFEFYTADFLRQTPRLLRIIISPYVMEFLLGSLLCHYTLQATLRWGVPLLLLGVALFLLGGYVNVQLFDARIDSGYFVLQRVALFGSAALCLVYGVVAIERQGRRPWPRASILLGGASYSLYLSHTLIIGLYARWGVVEAAAAMPGWLVWSGLILMILLYSVLHYLWVEHPLYLAGKRRFASR